MRRLIFVAAAACVLFAGCKNEVIMGNPQVTTLEVASLSPVSASLMGTVDSWIDGPGWEMGFQYSTSADFSDLKEVDAYYYRDGEYRYELMALTPSTHYYYRLFLRQGGVYFYGNTMEFTTLTVSSMIETRDAREEGQGNIRMEARLTLWNAFFYEYEYGFCVGSSAEQQDQKYRSFVLVGEDYYYVLYNIQPGDFWYKAYVTIDGNTYYGELKHYQYSI